LCLLNEALDLSYYSLLLFRQLSIGDRRQTRLRSCQALVDCGIVLALLFGGQNVAKARRRIGLPGPIRLGRTG